jgi:hypothetical protein
LTNLSTKAAELKTDYDDKFTNAAWDAAATYYNFSSPPVKSSVIVTPPKYAQVIVHQANRQNLDIFDTEVSLFS